MIAVFSGASTERMLAVHKLLDAEIKKGSTLVSFSDASFSREAILSYGGGADMFGTTYVVHLSRVSEHAEGVNFFLDENKVLASSSTLYVIEENEIVKELKDVFGASVREFKIAKPNFFGSLTAFTLVDAYNTRDKKNVWMLYLKLIENGVPAEEIAGAMMWNFKNLSLYFSVSKPTAVQLDMKPFVFSKVSTAAKLFSQPEIAEKAFHLTSALHDSHRGVGDGASLLELFILKSI